MSTTTLKRILVLHGYAQNGYIFSKRLSALRKQCKSTVEFVFVDAPHVLQPEDLFDNEPTESEENADPLKDPNAVLRGWWKFADKEKTISTGMETSLVFLRDLLKGAVDDGKVFNGVFGFSQGAAMGAVLTALLENPHKYPEFLINGKGPHPPLSLCVCAAGFLPTFPFSTTILTPNSSFTTPTLHICGLTDPIIPFARAKLLTELTPNGRIETHDGGHFVPSKNSWRKFIAAWLKNPLDAEIPSPEDSSTLDANRPIPNISNTVSPSPASE
ncbi:FSH1-domain-containing protein [Lentinula aff. detonsa]|nr:FSH1-domain-containing protein [Lentinula aff. detonsa]